MKKYIKTEEGNCIIEYPKKLFCSYNNINKKIIAIFTGNRAEYGLQFPVLKAIDLHPNFSNTKIEGKLITVFLKLPMDAEEFNKLLFTNGIILSHLVKRKESLEEQFLELTKN